MEELDGRRFNQRIFALQVFVEPVESVDAEFLGIFVRAFANLQADLVPRSVQFVDAACLEIDVDHAVEREDAVFIGVGDQQRPRRDQRSH